MTDYRYNPDYNTMEQKDPYDDYRDPKHGCLAVLVAITVTLTLCLCFPSCKTVQATTHSRDSIRVEVRHDSVYVYQHDSIFRDRWRAGDTVYVTLTQYKTLYKDKLVQVHDTTVVNHTETVTVSVPRDRTAYDRFCSWWFWGSVAVLLVIVGCKVAKVVLKFYGVKL